MGKRKKLISIVAGILVLAMLLSLLASLALSASAASSSEIRTQLDALEEQRASIEAQLDDLEQQRQENLSDIEDMVAQKNTIDQQVTLLYNQIETINDQITAYNVLIADTQDELDEAQARLEELNEKYKERIRAMEEEGSLSYWSVLFKANSFADLLDRLNMIEEIAEADQRRLAELRDAAEAVEETKERLSSEKEELQVTKDELTASQEALDVKRAEADEILNELISRGDEYTALLEEGEQQVESLMAEIAAQEQAYNEAKQREYEQWLATSVAPETEPEATDPEESGGTTQTDAPVSSSGWVIPCSYVYVSSPFNPNRVHPILGYARPHNGIDLAAYLNTPVVATRGGTVTTASYGSEAGNYVVINHGDGFSSVYMHLQSYTVSVGEYVNAGELIGYVGSTGLSEGPHLHFGISYNGTYVNPANYMNF